MKRPLILDISFYQDNPDTKSIFVNFDKMKLNADGVIFRVGQAEWEDKKLKEYLDASSNVGILTGGYWYYDNRYSPEKQADLCSSIVDKYSIKFNLPLFADFEDRRISSFSGWDNWYRFMERLKKNLPDVKIGVYTGYYYWLEFCPKEKSQRDYFGKFPLWIAQYPYDRHVDSSLYSNPKIPENTWKDWVFWQVSDRGDGHHFGVESSRVDVNYFNGTFEDFERSFGKVEETPEETKINYLNEKYFIINYKNKKVLLK